MEIGIGGGAIHIPGMGEEVRSRPEQADPRFGLFVPGIIDHDLQTFLRFAYTRSLIHQVKIMKTIKGNTHFGDEFKGIIHPDLCPVQGIRHIIPGEDPCAAAERIRTAAAEAVPVSNREPEMVLHGFAADFLSGIVPFE